MARGQLPRPATPLGSASATPAGPALFEELERAALLYEEGSVEEATRIYEEAIEDGDDSERQQALWALARLQYQEGDNSKAEDIVEEYLDEEISPEAERAALLLKGMVEFGQGRNSEAEESLKAYVAAAGPAAAYATLRLADLSARARRYAEGDRADTGGAERAASARSRDGRAVRNGVVSRGRRQCRGRARKL